MEVPRHPKFVVISTTEKSDWSQRGFDCVAGSSIKPIRAIDFLDGVENDI